MDELVIKLAELQAEVEGEDRKADSASSAIDRHIIDVKARLANLEKECDINRLPYTECAEELKTTIESLYAQIIDEWTGEKKTMVFGDRVLKFTHRGSLKIKDDAAMLEDLCIRMQSYAEVMKYLKGFNLTAVKKYMGVHDLPIDVAEIKYKTTVKLEQKSG